jgi:hypothetical protein
MNVASLSRSAVGLLLLGGAVWGVLVSGQGLRAPPPLAATWRVASDGGCLAEALTLTQSGVYLHGASGALVVRGKLSDERVTLTIGCGQHEARYQGAWTPERLSVEPREPACGCTTAIAAAPSP